MHFRLRATCIHLSLSALLALASALLVLQVWYPGQYRFVSGGLELFTLLIVVDVSLGPLLTFVIADSKKRRTTLLAELAAVCLLQILALAYGMNTVYTARPVVTVFEVDRFRVLTVDQIAVSELPLAPVGLQTLSLTGPRLIGTRAPAVGSESTDALFKGVEGVDIGQRPKFWQPYAASAAQAAAKARPMSVLLTQHSSLNARLIAQMRDMNIDPAKSYFLPVNARGDWVALLDSAGVLLGFLEADGFF